MITRGQGVAAAVEDLADGHAQSHALRLLLDSDPDEVNKAIKALPPRQRVRLLYDWGFWGRSDQVWRPGPEIHTFYLAGRGWGKTRVGAEAVRYVAEHPELAGGRARRGAWDRDHGQGAIIGIAGRTANDVNETMLYGPSGLMSICPPWARPRHYSSRKILVWPNGTVARLMSGDVPDSFRGPNFGFVWTDELAHWAKLAKSLRTLKLALRHGERPRAVHTTTPLGVAELLAMLFAIGEDGMPRPAREGEASLQGFALKKRVRVVVGSTYDNAANLADDFIAETVGEYEGTDEGEQELHGVIMLGRKGAPWRREWIKRCEPDDVPDLVAIFVAVDPTVSEGEIVEDDKPCECGIVVGGLADDGRLFVLEDASGVMSTRTWGAKVVQLVRKWDADAAVVEDNQGGELVETAIAIASPKSRVRVRRVHATKSKYKRAGLVAPLWEAGKVFHVGNPRGDDRNPGGFIRLEHQMCNFDPNKPEKSQRSDRMDAVVWLALAAAGDGTDRRRLRKFSNPEAWDRIRTALAANVRTPRRRRKR